MRKGGICNLWVCPSYSRRQGWLESCLVPNTPTSLGCMEHQSDVLELPFSWPQGSLVCKVAYTRRDPVKKRYGRRLKRGGRKRRKTRKEWRKEKCWGKISLNAELYRAQPNWTLLWLKEGQTGLCLPMGEEPRLQPNLCSGVGGAYT